MKTPFEVACEHYGLKEIRGSEHNHKILNFFAKIGHKWVQDDETAWCAAFANYCCLTSVGKNTGKLNARSFLEIGLETHTPIVGDIVILWRGSPNSWKGHVGFYVNEDDKYIYILGGNQSNEVNVSRYDKNRLLGYRRV